MSVDRFPGDLRIGVLQTVAEGVQDPNPMPLEPKFQILILLSGRQIFQLDHHRIELDAREAPHAVMMHVAKPRILRYCGSWGNPYTKISIATPCDWLDQFLGDDPAGDGLLTRHLDFIIWRPDREIARLALQIVNPPPAEAKAQVGLFRMSRGLEILRRALTDHLQNHRPGTDHRQAERIRLYLHSHLDDALSLERIEADLGLNRRSIQRSFLGSYGCTLSDYLRRERLARARRALTEEGVTVNQAAHLAGYTTAANFSTAFRRAFGVAPAQLRNRSI